MCASQKYIYKISGFDPAASAVRIGADLLVTNRHVVGNEKTVKIYLRSRKTIIGSVLPTSFTGDLILIKAALPDGPVARISYDLNGLLFTVGYDQTSQEIRVYQPGALLLAPNEQFQNSRIHHSAYSEPGNSGGALVDPDGGLVGIVTSGGNGRFEAIPAFRIKALNAVSGQQFSSANTNISAAYTKCILLTEKLGRMRRLQDMIAADLSKTCTASGNRQLIENAAKIFGQTNRLAASAMMFEKTLALDPNAINARIGYLITLHRLMRYSDEVKILFALMNIIPDEKNLPRHAIQVGKKLENQSLINKGLALIAKYSPNQLEAAKRFLRSIPAERDN